MGSISPGVFKTMKIMHIISGGDKGGAKTHMFALLDELCKIADVTVVCLMKGVFYEEILQRDVRTVLVEQKSRFDIGAVKKIEKLIKDEKFDIVNAHGARANFVVSFFNKKKLGIPVVTTVHSDYLLDFDSFAKKLIFTNLNIAALNKINYKIAVSDSFRDMLIGRGFQPNDILTVYNGMDFNCPAPHGTKEEFAQRFNIPYDKSKVYIGIAARLNRVKGVDIFLRSAAEVLKESDEARFVIIGEGEDEAMLKALAEELGIADKVYFLGFVREIYDFLNFIDINMLTSLSESFPYSILEGAKAKKATVASAVGGIPHLIKDSKTGYLFESQDYEECARKLLYLIDNKEMIAQLGENLYIKASTEFSNKALAESYLANYESFIKKYNRTKRYDILLSGYYGFNNFGDDMVLKTIVNSVKEEMPDTEIAILTKHPRETSLNIGVDSRDRYNFFDVIKTIKQSRIYAYGGGTLLTDVTSRKSLLYYTFTFKYAKHNGLKTAIIGNGVGPFIHKSSEAAAMGILSIADTVTLRDNDSYNLAKKASKNNISLTSDASLLYTPTEKGKNAKERFIYKNSLAPKGYFILSVREWKTAPKNYLAMIAQTADRMARQYSLTPLLIPIQMEKDRAVTEQLKTLINAESIVLPDENNNVDTICSLIDDSAFTLSMRLHPLIYSYSAGVPLLGISYDEKIDAFFRQTNSKDCIKLSELSIELLFEKASSAYENKNPSTDQRIEEMKKASMGNITALTGLLK